MKRSEQRALAIDERLRAELERKPTAALVDELHRIEAADDSVGARRLKALAAARAEVERDLGRARAALGERDAGDPAVRPRPESIAGHAVERLDQLRVQERAARQAASLDPPGRERGAAIERILGERRRISVESAMAMEPAYLIEALGPRPEGLRGRLEWERGVHRLEWSRQRLGVRDREHALGEEPSVPYQRAEWRRARRELEVLRARVAERYLTRDRERVAGLGIER